jgi:hypothetical protein
MSEKKWVVDLSAEERGQLLGLIRKGTAAARRLTRAHILLLAGEGRTDQEIAAALHANRSTAAAKVPRPAAGWPLILAFAILHAGDRGVIVPCEADVTISTRCATTALSI